MLKDIFTLSVDKSQKKIFYRLLFPAFVELLFLQMFQVMDSIMVGQIPDSTLAVASVGLCIAPINLIICVMSAFFIGTTATVAWSFGADDNKTVRDVAWQSMVLAFIAALIMTLISVFGAKPIMSFVCGESETLETAISYYKINAYGFFFQILSINITAAYRGICVTKLPMIYNLIGGVVNVILNYILIFGKFGFPAMNVEGAAWATTISKVVVFVVAVAFFAFKDSPISFKKTISLKPSKALIHQMLPIGFTSAGEQFILQSGATLSSKIISVLPTASIAASQVVASIEAFAWSTGNACSATSTSLFGRSLGEKDVKKARSYLSFTGKWALIFAFLEVAVFCLFGEKLAVLFSNDSSIYPMVTELLVISALAMPFINLHLTCSGALRSAGDSVAPLIASLISLWVFRVGMGYVVVSVLGMGVYAYRWCMTLDQFVRFLAVIIFFKKGRWKKRVNDINNIE